MKRVLLSLSAALAVAGCGLYTNIPAQIHVSEVKPATVTYDQADASGGRAAKTEQGQLTLIGDPGSIGATFEEMTIDYLEINKAPVAKTELPPMDLRMSVRVTSSNFPTDIKQPLQQAAVGVSVQAGTGTVTLPVVTRFVEQYGLRTNVGALTAQVQLSGFDDAGLPIKLAVYVPIIFHGGTGK